MSTESSRVVLLVVITEAVLEHVIVADLKKLGAKGYTATDARGVGSRGVRRGGESEGNVRFEIICGAALAERLLTHFEQRYYDNYGMVAYIADVQVLRRDKFL